MHNGTAEEKYRNMGNANVQRMEIKSVSGNPGNRGPKLNEPKYKITLYIGKQAHTIMGGMTSSREDGGTPPEGDSTDLLLRLSVAFPPSRPPRG